MGKWKKRLIITAIISSMTIGLCGCGASARKDSDGKGTIDDGLVIGFSFDTFVLERWIRDADIFTSKIKEYDSNATVNVQNANGDIETQISQIRYLIDKEVDVLVIVAIDAESLGDVLEEAKAAGIPIIAYDRLIKNANVDLYISFDNEKVGTLMGKYLVDAKLPHKKVFMMAGAIEDNNVSMVDKGFRKVMEDNNIEIVDCYYTPGWRADMAADYVDSYYSELKDVDGIMCGNDGIATAVIRKLSEYRLADKIKVVGQDADLEACQRIVEGTQVMTVYKPVEKLASTAAKYAIDLANGKEINTDNYINDGTYEIPYSCLDIIAVTKENMDEEIIDSGFHMRDDVYLNVKE